MTLNSGSKDRSLRVLCLDLADVGRQPQCIVVVFGSGMCSNPWSMEGGGSGTPDTTVEMLTKASAGSPQPIAQGIEHIF